MLQHIVIYIKIRLYPSDIHPTSENIHTKGAQTWTPQNENKAERRDSFILIQTHFTNQLASNIPRSLGNLAEVQSSVSIVTCYELTIDGVLDRILDLLAIYTQLGTTSNYSPIANLHHLQITTAPSKIFHPLVSSPAVHWQRLLTVEILHALKSSLNRGFHSTAAFPHRLHYRTDSVATIVFLITPLHGPSRKHRFQQYLCFCMRAVVAGMCLPSRCLETNVVLEPFASNVCFCGSTVLALSKHATVCLNFLSTYGYGRCAVLALCKLLMFKKLL
jgi:hypothetical protein